MCSRPRIWTRRLEITFKRFHANDQRDIDAMVDLGLVSHGARLDRFRLAVDWFLLDARAAEIHACIANLNRVERDSFGLDESIIELPAWLDG